MAGGRGWGRDAADMIYLGSAFASMVIIDEQWKHRRAELGYSTSGAFVQKVREGRGPLRFSLTGMLGVPGPGFI